MSVFPEYELYGENRSLDPEFPNFWLHCEAISDRSRIHGWEIKPHSHRRFIQLLYIWEGEGELLRSGGKDEPLVIPAVVEVPSGAVHGFRFSHDVQGFIVSVVTDRLKQTGAGASREQPVLRQTHLEPGDREAMRLDHMLREIEIEYRMHDHGDAEILAAAVQAAKAMIARINRDDPKRSTGSSGKRARDQQRLAILQTLITAHLREHRPVSFYADTMQMSAAHLNRICQRHTGLSTRDLIAAQLADEARRSLVFTMLSVKQIAFNLGFQDPAYFTRFFLKQTGRRPSDYREARRAQGAVVDPSSDTGDGQAA